MQQLIDYATIVSMTVLGALIFILIGIAIPALAAFLALVSPTFAIHYLSKQAGRA